MKKVVKSCSETRFNRWITSVRSVIVWYEVIPRWLLALGFRIPRVELESVTIKHPAGDRSTSRRSLELWTNISLSTHTHKHTKRRRKNEQKHILRGPAYRRLRPRRGRTDRRTAAVNKETWAHANDRNVLIEVDSRGGAAVSAYSQPPQRAEWQAAQYRTLSVRYRH